MTVIDAAEDIARANQLLARLAVLLDRPGVDHLPDGVAAIPRPEGLSVVIPVGVLERLLDEAGAPADATSYTTAVALAARGERRARTLVEDVLAALDRSDWRSARDRAREAADALVVAADWREKSEKAAPR